MRSSICPLVGRTSTSGSIRPVGRITCSVTVVETRFSNGPGVADTYSVCGVLSRNSSNVNGRLSSALGSRNPCSTSVALRARSPSYMPPTCGIVTWLSSTISR